MQGLLSVEQLDAFLVPLSGGEPDSPAGDYLKSNRALYRPLRNAYNIAQTSLQKLSLNPDPAELDALEIVNRDNWLNLRVLLLEVLEKSSRDLECLAWLAMAQLFTAQPFAQLALTIRLIERIVREFGEQVQPFLPEEKLRSTDPDNAAMERAEVQGRALKLLFGESEESCQIAVPLRMLPLVSDIDYARYQREEAGRNELQQQVKSAFAAYRKNDIDSVVTRINDIQDALDELNALDRTLIAHFKKSNMPAPGSRFLQQALEANLLAIQDLTEGLITPWPPDVRKASRDNGAAMGRSREAAETGSEHGEVADISSEVTSGVSENQADGAGLSFNRNQAFHQLRLLSDYFKHTEPQSPVSYLLEKAIRWGYTPLPELMNELMQGNDHLLSRVTELTGMNMTHRTPIPGISAAGLSQMPEALTKSSATKPADTQPHQRPESVEGQDIPKVKPEQVETDREKNSRQPDVDTGPQPSTSDGPGGLNISNLDDLV